MTSAFVQYLVDQGLIGEEHSTEIVAWADKREDPVGLIAVEHGLIAGKQVHELLDRLDGVGLRITDPNEVAGGLTQNRLRILHGIQERRQWIQVVEAILLSGLVSESAILRAYAEFILEHEQGDRGNLARAA